jgi:hypothetical protein
MEISAEIVPFEDPKLGNFFSWDVDGGESPPERGLKMGTVFHLLPHGDFVSENY